MKFKTSALILSIMFLILGSAAWSDDVAKPPAELAKLQLSWEVAKARQLKPIDERQVKSLKDMMARYKKAGDLDSAVAVKNELARFDGDGAADDTELSADAPADLAKLRTSWATARKRALDPLDKKYAKGLNDIVKFYTKADDLDSALIVKAELDRFLKDRSAADKTTAEKDAPKTLTIIKAIYGTDEQLAAKKGSDVTEKLRKQIKDGKISVKVSPSVFGDPKPFKGKTMIVDYIKGGSKKVRRKEFKSGGPLELP